MPWSSWTAPAFTGALVWEDLPSEHTPVNALDLNTSENAPAIYAAVTAQSVYNSITGQLPDPALIPVSDATGVGDFGALIYNSLSGKWRASAGGPINVLDARYGAKGNGTTDDTAAAQAAINDANTAYVRTGGPVGVVLPSGYEFLLGQLSIKPGVHLFANGAAIVPNLSNWSITAGAGFLFWAGTGILTDFAVHGGTWLGTGAEASNQFVFFPGSNRGIQDVTLEGMKITNWGVPPFYLRNPTRVRVLFNTILRPAGATNAANDINFVFDGGATAGGEIVALGNIIENSWGASIAAVVASTFTGAMKAIFVANITNGTAGSTASSNNSGAISFEVDAALAETNAIIAFNDINATCTNAGAYAALLGSGAQNAIPSKIHFALNNVKSAKNGVAIGLSSPETTVALNRFDIAGTLFPNSAPTQQFGNRLSGGGGASQGRATLVAGTVTVSTAEVQAGDNVQLTVVAPGGTRGIVQLGTITAGTSFAINSIQPGTASTLQAADTSTVFWQIIH